MCNGETEEIEHVCTCGHTRETARVEAERRRARVDRLVNGERPVNGETE